MVVHVQEPNNNHYPTSDTSLAGYLYCMGFPIVDIDYSEPRAVILFKEDNASIREYERLFYTDQAKVTPATFSRIVKRLNVIIRNKSTWEQGVLNV